MAGTNLNANPIHLGLGATAIEQPTFTGEMDWYMQYGEQHGVDGAEGRLVTLHTFTESWDVWEIHPHGSEVVLCTDGKITLHQEQLDGSVTQVTLSAGEYAINPPGIWHTADIEGTATALFITAGMGTENKAR